MSKIMQESKEAKLKGKQKKIAKSTAKKAASADAKETESSSSRGKVLNYGCCCTCAHFPHKANHETQPCKVSGKYVARKAKFECYKCKFG